MAWIGPPAWGLPPLADGAYTYVVLWLVRRCPQPLKTLLVLLPVVMVAGVVVSAMSRDDLAAVGQMDTQAADGTVSPLALLAVGAVATAIGVVLAADVRGNARAYFELRRRTRAQSGWVGRGGLSSVGAVRLAGVVWAVVGLAFVVSEARGL